MSLGRRHTVSNMSTNQIMNNSPAKGEGQQYDGHTYDFVGKIPDELTCKICSKVLRDPRQVVCCGQHYCQGCIEKRITVNFACPSCKTQNFNHFRDVHFEQRINTLKIHCPHYRRGCRWTGDLTMVKSHLNSVQGCAYEGVPCPNKCGQGMARKDVKDHLMKQCTLRKVRCQHCNHENTFQVITGSHSSVCPNYPVKCPHNCGQKGIRRSEVSKHDQQCPLKPMFCPFQSAGCKAKIVQKDFGDHMTTFTQQHLDMVSNSFETLKNRAESAENELKMTKVEVDQLKLRQQSGRDMVDKRMVAIKNTAEELLKSCPEGQKFLAQSILSLSDEAFHLNKIGQPIIFQMINYSEFKRSGKVWYSAPFYISDGYKMCLAAYADGVGTARGNSVSIALCLMQGEFDEELRWPIELPFHLIIEVLRKDDSGADPPPNPRAYMYFHSDKPQERVIDGLLIEARKCENFARHDIVDDWMLFYDSITFQITAESEFL